jgi:hypothetical protein
MISIPVSATASLVASVTVASSFKTAAGNVAVVELSGLVLQRNYLLLYCLQWKGLFTGHQTVGLLNLYCTYVDLMFQKVS